jgi:hypothetical protein
MNTYYGIRFHRPMWLFSPGVLSVPVHIGYQEPADSGRHGRLTNSSPPVSMARVADFATAFMDSQS